MRIKILIILGAFALLTSCKKTIKPLPIVQPPVDTTVSLINTSTIRSDGTILVDGIPFFPFGAYSVEWTETNQNRIDCLNEIADAGFNTTSFTDAGPGSITPVLIQQANDKNIKVFLSAPASQWIADVALEYKNNKCILAYILADDGDDGRTTLQDIITRNSNVKNIDPKHLTFLTLTGYYGVRRDDVNTYSRLPDITGYQCYPITPPSDYDVTSSNALTETYIRTLLYVKSAEISKKPCLMHLQTFTWQRSNLSNRRFPTILELRNMMYSGLCAGVKGILSYDFSFDLKNNQIPLWNEFKTLRTDVSTLEGALMNGIITRVNTGDQELICSYWIYNDLYYMVVVNTSYTTSKNVSIALPASFTGIKTSLFSRMNNTLTVNGTNLTGSIAAQEVQVFSIAKF